MSEATKERPRRLSRRARGRLNAATEYLQQSVYSINHGHNVAEHICKVRNLARRMLAMLENE